MAKRLNYKICCLNSDAKWEIYDFSLPISVTEEGAFLRTTDKLSEYFDKGNIILIVIIFIKGSPKKIINKNMNKGEVEIKDKDVEIKNRAKGKYKPLCVSYEKYCFSQEDIDNIEEGASKDITEKKGIILEPIETKKFWDEINSINLFEIIGFILKKIHRGADIRNLELI